MKIKKGYLLHEVAGNYVIIAIGQEAVNFNGLMTVSESGKLLWELLSRDEGASFADLSNAILNEYDVTKEIAENDIYEFLNDLKKNNLID